MPHICFCFFYHNSVKSLNMGFAPPAFSLMYMYTLVDELCAKYSLEKSSFIFS